MPLPEGCGHPRLIKHGDNPFFHRPVAPLCNTILLRAIPDSVLTLDALNAEHLKLPGHVLSTLVIPQGAQCCPGDILSPSFELLECSKSLRLSLQEVTCLEAREVINESDPIAVPLMCRHLDRAMLIAVDELEGFSGPGGRRGEWICMHLSSFQLCRLHILD